MAELIRNGELQIGDGYRAKNSELSQSGIPFARAGNIDAGFAFDGADRFPSETLHKVGNKVSAVGDVVFTSKGTVGRFAYVDVATERFVYAPQLCFWRSLNPNKIDSYYLFCWMHGHEFGDQIDALKGQTDMADYVSLTDQRLMKISLPDIEEQRAVVSVIEPLNRRIALNEKLNAALEATAAALFKSWFVDFDPVVAKSEGSKPFGMTDEIAALFPNRFAPNGLPEGWEQESIYSIASVQYGAPYKSDRFNTDQRGLPLIRIRDLPNQGSDVYTEEQHARDVIISPGDLVVGMDGEFRAYLWGGEQSRMNQRVCKFVPHDQKDRCFVWETIKPQLWDIESTEVATTVIHLGKGDIDGFKVTHPQEPLRSAFSRITEPLLDRVILNEKQNRALRNLRDAILPGLVSGELQIKDEILDAEKSSRTKGDRLSKGSIQSALFEESLTDLELLVEKN